MCLHILGTLYIWKFLILLLQLFSNFEIKPKPKNLQETDSSKNQQRILNLSSESLTWNAESQGINPQWLFSYKKKKESNDAIEKTNSIFTKRSKLRSPKSDKKVLSQRKI